MKKLMFSMLVMLASTVFATSAFAQEEGDAIIYGSNSIESDYYIYAWNTSWPYDEHDVCIRADHTGVNYLYLPPGTYDLMVSVVSTPSFDLDTTFGGPFYDVYDQMFYGVSFSSDQTDVVTVGHF